MQRMRCASVEDARTKAKALQDARISLSGNEYFKYLNVRFLVVPDGSTKGAFINATIHNFMSVYVTVHVLSMEDAKIGAFLSHVFICYLCEYDALCGKQGRKIQEHPQQRLIREHAFCVALALNTNVQPPARVYGTAHTVESLVEMLPATAAESSPASTLSSTEKEELRTSKMAVERLRENVAEANRLYHKATEEARQAKEEKKKGDETLKAAKEESKALAVQCANLQTELQQVKKTQNDGTPITPPSCTTFASFVNTRYHGNYVLGADNPTYGYTILRNIKQREELRQKKNKPSWTLEEAYNFEPLDSETPVTQKHIQFLMRYHENKDYAMRRLNNHEEKIDGPIPHSEKSESENAEEESEEPPAKKSKRNETLVDMLVEDDAYLAVDPSQFNIDWMSNYEE